jgi:hypothetical protein
MLLGRSVLVQGSFESCTLLDGAFCKAHRALLNIEFKIASKQHELICADFAGIPLHVMRLSFSPEVRVFAGDFTRNRLPVVLSLLSQNRMFSRVRG